MPNLIGLQVQHQRGEGVVWKLKSGGFGRGEKALIMEAQRNFEPGQGLTMDFGADKLDSDLLLNYGVLDEFVSRVSPLVPVIPLAADDEHSFQRSACSLDSPWSDIFMYRPQQCPKSLIIAPPTAVPTCDFILVTHICPSLLTIEVLVAVSKKFLLAHVQHSKQLPREASGRSKYIVLSAGLPWELTCFFGLKSYGCQFAAQQQHLWLAIGSKWRYNLNAETLLFQLLSASFRKLEFFLKLIDKSWIFAFLF